MALTFDLEFLPIGFHNKLLPVFPKGLVYNKCLLINIYVFFYTQMLGILKTCFKTIINIIFLNYALISSII